MNDEVQNQFPVVPEEASPNDFFAPKPQSLRLQMLVDVDDVLPEGDYLCRLVSVDPEYVSKSGNPCVVWDYMVTDPKAGIHSGTTLKVYTVTQGAGAFKFTETIKALNVGTYVPQPDGTRKLVIDVDVTELVGKTVMARVVHQEYDGNKRPSISKVMPAPKTTIYG